MLKLLFLLLNITTVYAQCEELSGILRDIQGNGIAHADLSARVERRIVSLGRTDRSGNYQVRLPCAAHTLLIEAKGYKPLELPVFLDQKKEGKFYVPLVMYPVDRQQNDKPYSQTEQRHYIIQEKGRKRMPFSRSLQVLDAFSGDVLPAEVCLFYTQLQKRDCFQLTIAKPVYDMEFTENDIVAIEIKSPGYQSYHGNLILDQPDQQEQCYTIQLTRQPVIFGIFVSSPNAIEKCEVTRTTGALPMTRAMGSRFYVNFSKEGVVSVVIFPGKPDTPSYSMPKISLRPGINLRAYSLVDRNEADNSSFVQLPGDRRILYFGQSDYRLTEEARHFLDSLGAFLKADAHRKVTIIGHTDNIGRSDLNRTLSEFRAKVTASYLISKGVSENVISWSGAGGDVPLQPNDTEENKKKNRRVEIRWAGL